MKDTVCTPLESVIAGNSVHELYEKLIQISVINTHDHLWDESWRLHHPGDWTTLFYHYGITALKMSGMTDREADLLYAPETPHNTKWAIFSPFFKKAKNAACMKAPILAIHDLYGIDKFDQDAMQELTNRMQRMIRPGFYRYVLREKAGIDYCMINCFDCDDSGNRYPARFSGDTDLLRPDLYGDIFIYPAQRNIVQQETGEDCSTLTGWIQAIDKYFETYIKRCCSIKIALAYLGRLNFSPAVKFETATQCYDRLITGATRQYEDIRPLVDYLFHYLVKKAITYKIPIKFHTGLYSGANTMNYPAIRHNIQDLVDLALIYRDCSFIAMHLAYPYQNELIPAVRQIANVYADMSWSWIVDPHAASVFLKSAVTSAPVSKIMGFGGDYAYPENTYGHLQLARQFIAMSLADLINCGYFSQQEAVTAAHYLMRDSAQAVYA